MKILMTLEHDYPPDIRVEKEIASLIKAGYKVSLACLTHQSCSSIEKREDLTIYRRKIPALVYKSSVGALKFPFYFNFWRTFLADIVERESFDVLHIHDLPLASLALEIRRKYHTPCILDLHENYPWLLQASLHTQTIAGKILSSYQQWINYEKKMVLEADLLLSVVEEQRDRLSKLVKDPQKIFLVSNTPTLEDTTNFEKVLTRGRYSFIYAGNIDATRGLEILLLAFKEVTKKEPDAFLRLVGDSRKPTALLQLARTLAINENIVFYGWKPYRELLELINSSDCALLPHLRNGNSDFGIPNKLFQYMMMGKPVIASDCPPVERILTECNAGLIYPDRDIKKLAEKMLYAIDHPLELAEQGLNGKRGVYSRYNWGESAKNLLAAYRLFS